MLCRRLLAEVLSWSSSMTGERMFCYMASHGGLPVDNKMARCPAVANAIGVVLPVPILERRYLRFYWTASELTKQICRLFIMKTRDFNVQIHISLTSSDITDDNIYRLIMALVNSLHTLCHTFLINKKGHLFLLSLFLAQ